MITTERLVALYKERKLAQAPILGQMEKIRQAYNGDLAVVLPQIDKYETPAVANLVAQGIDQTALRIASTMPNVEYPVLRPEIKASQDKARDRRRATLGWWEDNRLRVKLGRRSRHFIAYGMAPVSIGWDRKMGIPSWTVRNPLMTFAAPSEDPDEISPEDCIFAYTRTLGWLKRFFPNEIAGLEKGPSPKNDDKYELLEYSDADEQVLIVVGRKADPYQSSSAKGSDAKPLLRFKNPAGMCSAVVPGRITLDRLVGQFDGMLGMYQQQARLTALSIIAIQRGIFPETWLEGRQNETPDIVVEADANEGIVGITKGGSLRNMVDNPGYQTFPLIDRLQEAQRVEGGVPAEFGGQSSSNIRTGRRGDAVLSATVDFRVQEAHEMFAESLQHENRIAIATMKGMAGGQKKSFHVNWLGEGANDYTPDTIFETDSNKVTYAMPGSDKAGLLIGIGQRIGIGTMSKRTGAELDPDIQDPELEHDRTVAEALEAALLSGIQARVNALDEGGLDPAAVAQMILDIRNDKMDLAEAYIKANKETKEAAAKVAQGQAPLEEMAPGLAAPGQGADQGLAIAPPAESVPSAGNLAQLMGALRRPAMRLPEERSA